MILLTAVMTTDEQDVALACLEGYTNYLGKVLDRRSDSRLEAELRLALAAQAAVANAQQIGG